MTGWVPFRDISGHRMIRRRNEADRTNAYFDVRSLRGKWRLSYKSILTNKPDKKAKIIVNKIYSTNRLKPSTIFKAPRFVIFVAGPVIINAHAAPILMPPTSHHCNKGIVPPPQAYNGTPIVAAMRSPKASLFPNNATIQLSGM